MIHQVMIHIFLLLYNKEKKKSVGQIYCIILQTKIIYILKTKIEGHQHHQSNENTSSNTYLITFKLSYS